MQNDGNLAEFKRKRICPVIFQAHRGQNVAQHAEVDGARRDGKSGGKLADLARGELALDEFARDARNAEANLRQVDKKAARAELDLRREPDAALEEVFFKVSARGGLLFKKNERECGDLLGRVGAG